MNHKCPVCGVVFDNLRGLRTHYSQMHPDSGPLEEAEPDGRHFGPDERFMFKTSVLINGRQRRWLDSNVTNFSEWVRMRIDEEMNSKSWRQNNV